MQHADILQMQKDNHLSSQTFGVLKSIRRGCGDHLMFQAHYKDAIQKLNALFADYFSTTKFDTGDPDTEDVWCCFASRLTDLLHRVEKLHQRKIRRVLLGGDAGQQFLKIVITLEWTERAAADEKEEMKNDNETNDANSSSLLIIANIPLCNETYTNCERIFKLPNILLSSLFYLSET